MHTVAFDERLLTELNEDVGEFDQDVKLGSAIWFYVRHKLTLGQAAKLADRSQFDFMKALNEHGIAVVDYPASDLADEIEST